MKSNVKAIIMRKSFMLGFFLFPILYISIVNYITHPSFIISYGQRYSEYLFYLITFLPRYENDGYELMQSLFNILVYGIIGGLIFVSVAKLVKK